jgi:uncharacterized protein YgbK (DUF1537 family)
MIRLGVIADDFTGATDIAGFLVANGMRTVQLSGPPSLDSMPEADAVVISLKSRSAPVNEAVRDSLSALEWLRNRGCQQVFFKYCSTFDSTSAGNIGPVTDALLAALEADFTVICPALPVNGRTIYNGYLFVHGIPLHESGMRHHPVTPMLDSNLMRLMDGQAQGKTGNVPESVVAQGHAAVRSALADLRKAGHRYAVLDAISDEDLVTVGRAIADMPLVTGGSGLADGLARHFSAKKGQGAEAMGAPLAGRAVILSGSCSEMTNRQVATYATLAPSKAISVDRAIADADTYVDELIDWVNTQETTSAPMLFATALPNVLAQNQDLFGADRAGRAVEDLLSRVAIALPQHGFTRFIVAGGETSGAVTLALGITGFHIGPQIAPGVPWVRAIDKPLSLALKSGNFGQVDFFARSVAS